MSDLTDRIRSGCVASLPRHPPPQVSNQDVLALCDAYERLLVLYEATASVATRLQAQKAEWTEEVGGRMVLTPAGQRALDHYAQLLREGSPHE